MAPTLLVCTWRWVSLTRRRRARLHFIGREVRLGDSSLGTLGALPGFSFFSSLGFLSRGGIADVMDEKSFASTTSASK